MKTKIGILLCIAALLTSYACNDIEEILNLAGCTYEYDGVTNPTVAGVSFDSGTEISIENAAKLLAAYNIDKSLPLSTVVLVEAKNPNSRNASLYRLEWAIDLDGQEITTGIINEPVRIPANGVQVIPFTLQMDVYSLVSNGSVLALTNLVKNLNDAGEESSNISIRIKPTILIAGQQITSPRFFSIRKNIASS